ncbi:maltose permease [Colletotrichum orchidophilum]|uniref:Maltose permease n=1 Tax=Colletotrichum orchidophilum TaxID=1209926 RepID=A0A1G4BE59_9PEZI|nr:maltose permease [Colletotrichum orchidophilum]OHE99648.1 maltose permease [Colletotrichum orchidophilum]
MDNKNEPTVQHDDKLRAEQLEDANIAATTALPTTLLPHGLVFLPESLGWLLINSLREEAFKSYKRFNGPNFDADAARTAIVFMVYLSQHAIDVNFVYGYFTHGSVLASLTYYVQLRRKPLTASTSCADRAILFDIAGDALPAEHGPSQLGRQDLLHFLRPLVACDMCVWLYFYFSEMKGRNYAEFQEKMGNRVPARKFKSYVCEVSTGGGRGGRLEKKKLQNEG